MRRSAHARFRDTGLFFHPRQSTSRASLPVPSKSPLTGERGVARASKKKREGREIDDMRLVQY